MKQVLLNPEHYEHTGGSFPAAAPHVVPEPAPVATATTKDSEADDESDTSDTIIATQEGLDFVASRFEVSKKSGVTTPITGWGFPSVRFHSVGEAVSHFEKICRKQNKTTTEEKKNEKGEDITVEIPVTGEMVALDAIQTAYDSKLRIRVKSMTPNVGDDGYPTVDAVQTWFDGKQKDNPNKFLLTVEQVYEWIPGLRELSKSKQLELQVKSIRDLVAKHGANSPEAQAAIIKMATSMV